MKEVTLKIPDKKLSFFFELMKQLGFEISSETEVPEEHKSIVRERIKTAQQEDMIPWKEARKKLSFNDKS
jgi:hypothetical protein